MVNWKKFYLNGNSERHFPLYVILSNFLLNYFLCICILKCRKLPDRVIFSIKLNKHYANVFWHRVKVSAQKNVNVPSAPITK